MEMDDWPVVKFGDFVRRVKTKFDPNQSDIELFVAGRHIDSGDLAVRRWGYLSEEYVGPAFNTIFTPGQVLYVSVVLIFERLQLPNLEVSVLILHLF